MRTLTAILTGVLLTLPGACVGAEAIDSIEALGRALFFDVNLSRNRTQPVQPVIRRSSALPIHAAMPAAGRYHWATTAARWATAMRRPRPMLLLVRLFT